MKRLIIIPILLIFFACSSVKQESNETKKVNPLANTAWRMDYSMEIKEDTTFSHLPEDWVRIKMYTNNRWNFTGYDYGKQEVAGMAGGTYSLEGTAYTENIEFHYHAPFNGKVFNAELTVEGDYLYQRGQVDSLLLEERWHRID